MTITDLQSHESDGYFAVVNGKDVRLVCYEGDGEICANCGDYGDVGYGIEVGGEFTNFACWRCVHVER